MHAFNPHPLFMHELRRNLMLNGLDGSICLHESAVSNRSNARVSLEYAVGSGIVGQPHAHEHGRHTWAEVNTTTLDDWAAMAAPQLLAQQPAFLLVKLDVEVSMHRSPERKLSATGPMDSHWQRILIVTFEHGRAQPPWH